ncbi:hypothetical protein ACLKA6_008843 [Drosophila palustris]
MGARELGPLLEIEEIQTRTEDDASRQTTTTTTEAADDSRPLILMPQGHGEREPSSSAVSEVAQLSWFVDFLAAISQDIHSHLYTAGAICNENPNANAKSRNRTRRVATRHSVLI